MAEKRALVTGAGGFMGFPMTKLLSKNGYDVKATDLNTGEKILMS